MILTQENYHSMEAKKAFMGASQFKDFMDCEARALAIINGEFELQSDAFLAGHYLDAHFEGTLDIFRAQHSEMFMKTKPGVLLDKYRRIDECINVIENDPIMLDLCSGEQQKIMTGEIAGVPFKIMIDSYHKDKTVDRKAMADFKDKYSEKEGMFVPWWKFYRYDTQAAIYTEIRRQNEGKAVPFDLVAVSKEPVPDKALIRFSPEYLERVLEEVQQLAPKFQSIKDGFFDPESCGNCDFCKNKKRLVEPEMIR